MEQHILDHKYIDDKYIAQFFEKLLIDTTFDRSAPVYALTSASDSTVPKMFLTSFGKMQVESIGTTKILADKTLKHRIISTNNDVSLTLVASKLYSFNVSTNCYNYRIIWLEDYMASYIGINNYKQGIINKIFYLELPYTSNVHFKIQKISFF